MYIGVDLGSTNIKAAIYNKDFDLIDRQSRPVEYIRENGFVEFDAWAYYQELAGLLKDMLAAGAEYGAKWYCAGKVSKKGHPHHPLYLRKDEKIRPFDVESYLNGVML